VHESVHAELVREMNKSVASFFGPEPRASADYGRLCTVPHAARMVELITSSGGRVVCGGADSADAAARFVPPTIIDEPRKGSPVLTQEIFGPILPVVAFGGAGVKEAVAFIQSTDATPLALYVFTGRTSEAQELLKEVQSGDAIVNDTFMHALNPDIPFGGVGRSGHGTYRGRFSFDTFTYQRGVLWRHGLFDIDQTLPFNVRYPPTGAPRKALLPHAIGLFPCVPPLFVWRPRLFAILVLFSAAVAAVVGAEAAGAPPISFARAQLAAWWLRAAVH